MGKLPLTGLFDFCLIVLANSYFLNCNFRLVCIIDKITHIGHLSRVAPLLIGNFYARPDTNDALLKGYVIRLKMTFEGNAHITHESVSCLRAIAALLKSVNRLVMINTCIEIVIQLASDCLDDEQSGKHELIIKFCVKILGRSAMCLMKPKVLQPRYDLGHRIASIGGNENTTVTTADQQQHGDNSNEVDDAEEDFDDTQMELFETIVQRLLERIEVESTVVRYSVSKYLAAICGRLPSRFSLDLLDYITDKVCSDMANDAAWHGSCLTLAQFVARRLIPVDRLGTSVVPLVRQALFYDQLKGSFALGAHVRDAAAYVCYSLPRAYRQSEIEPFVGVLAPALLCMACFDRELNCRRAASAVIQEWTGRTSGQFPHWPQVIEKTEFNELNQLEHSFLSCGVTFCAPEFEIFHRAIVEHLVEKAQTHWKVDIRRLAARALGEVAHRLPLDKVEPAWSQLASIDVKDGKTFGSLAWRHGTILSWSYLIEKDVGLLDRSEHFVTEIETVLEKLKTRELLQGYGGDLMKEAILRLIGVIYQTKRNFSIEPQWRQFIFETLDSFAVENVTVQTAIIDTFVALVDFYAEQDEVFRQLAAIISKRQHLSVATVCSVVTKVNLVRIAESFKVNMLKAIIEYMLPTINSPTRRPETLADAVKAMVVLTCNVDLSLREAERNDSIKLLRMALSDHTVDQKGDTGLPVRLSAIEVVSSFVQHNRHLFSYEQLLELVQLVAAEAAFHRNRTFGPAFKTLAYLMLEESSLSAVLLDQPLAEPFRALAAKCGDDCNLANSLDTVEHYKLVVNLLDVPELTWHLLSGLLCVLADPVLEGHGTMVVEHLNNATDVQRATILDVVLQFYDANINDQRLLLPMMVAIKQIIISVAFTNVDRSCERIVSTTWRACDKGNNFKKYVRGVDILTALVPLNVHDNLPQVRPYLKVLLGHRSPRVRQHTAMEMFPMLVVVESELSCHPQVFQDLYQLLQETDWMDSNLDLVRKSRDRVMELLKQL